MLPTCPKCNAFAPGGRPGCDQCGWDFAQRPPIGLVEVTDILHVAGPSWIQLPTFFNVEDNHLAVASTDRSRTYEVNLSGPDCTCPDWRERRAAFPVRDIRRCCKHVLELLQTPQRLARLQGLARLWCVESNEPYQNVPPFDKLEAYQIADYFAVLSQVSCGEWVNVLTVKPQPRKTRPYQVFGFNLVEERWSYSDAPKNANALRVILKRWEYQPKQPSLFCFYPS